MTPPSDIATIPYQPRPPQDDIHKVLDKTRFVVLVAHRRMGKTVLAVIHLIQQALACKREQGFFGYVAPFRNQAKAIAWRYLTRYTENIRQRINETELSVTFENGARVRLFGADNPDALRGLYFDGVVLDEVAQMRPCVWQEILRPTLADRNGFAVFIGTPRGMNLFYELYELARREQRAGNPEWAALSYPASKTTALPQKELDRLRNELSDNVFRQEFLCDFLAAADDALIAPEDVFDAASRHVPFRGNRHDPGILGVDVARFGSDSTVFILRSGLACMEPVILHGADNMLVADRLAAFIREFEPIRVCIDAGGGAGVIDRLRRLGFDPVEVPFGGRALDSERFANRRMEMWWNIREWLKGGGAIPDNRSLRDDLCTPTYSFDDNGRMKLESKDSIRERLGHSPDVADALALTFAVPLPRHGTPVHRNAKTSYDIACYA